MGGPPAAGAEGRAGGDVRDGSNSSGGSAAQARLLFVCLGNICRSPTAEAVMQALVEREGLAGQIELDSAGTGAWHVGSSPDRRATAAARARGITLAGHARQVRSEDFADFDLLLAMDRTNLEDLRRIAPGEREREKVRLLREFDPASAGSRDLDVPDPYFGAHGGFEEVLDLVQSACAGLLERIRTHGAP
jgi:low molecular weight protein-tyrosine phosphatase